MKPEAPNADEPHSHLLRPGIESVCKFEHLLGEHGRLDIIQINTETFVRVSINIPTMSMIIRLRSKILISNYCKSCFQSSSFQY